MSSDSLMVTESILLSTYTKTLAGAVAPLVEGCRGDRGSAHISKLTRQVEGMLLAFQEISQSYNTGLYAFLLLSAVEGSHWNHRHDIPPHLAHAGSPSAAVKSVNYPDYTSRDPPLTANALFRA